MTDTQPNGNMVDIADVEMKEEEAINEPSLSSIQHFDQSEMDTRASSDPQLLDTTTEPAATESPSPAVFGSGAAQLSATTPAPQSSSTAQAPSTRVGSLPPQPAARPEKPVAHGGPTRQFLNTNVTPHLLEAMKYLAVHEPEKPLMWLSEFLRDRSKEVEGP